MKKAITVTIDTELINDLVTMFEVEIVDKQTIDAQLIDEHTKLKKSYEELGKIRDRWMNRAIGRLSIINMLKKECDNLRKERAEVMEALNTWKDSHNVVTFNLEERSKELADAIAAKNKAEADWRELVARQCNLDKKVIEYDALADKLQKLSKELSDAKSAKLETETAYNDLNTKCIALEQENEVLSENLRTVIHFRDIWKKKAVERLAELKELKGKTQKVTMDWKPTVAAQADEIESLKHELNSAIELHKFWKTRSDDAHTKLNERNREISALRDALADKDKVILKKDSILADLIGTLKSESSYFAKAATHAFEANKNA